jgi:hypothetical protein
MLFCLSGLDFLATSILHQFPSFPYFILEILLLLLPSAGYLDTIRLMIVAKTPTAYDFRLIMIVTSAQAMKITFFFYHRYSIIVFGQALTVFLSATLLTFLKFHYSVNETGPDIDESPSKMVRIACIWKNTSFTEYVFSLACYSLVLFGFFLIACFIAGRQIAAETLGFIANLVELTISLPLFLQVVVERKLKHVSPILVLQYASGDVMRLILFVMVKTPWMFTAGASLSLAVTLTTAVCFFKFQGSEMGPLPETHGVDVGGDTARIIHPECSEEIEEESD